MLQSRGQNQKRLTDGHGGCTTLPNASTEADKFSSAPQVDLVATQTPPSWGSPHLQGGEQNHKRPTRGLGGHITTAVWGGGGGIAAEWGTKSEVAHM